MIRIGSMGLAELGLRIDGFVSGDCTSRRTGGLGAETDSNE